MIWRNPDDHNQMNGSKQNIWIKKYFDLSKNIKYLMQIRTPNDKLAYRIGFEEWFRQSLSGIAFRWWEIIFSFFFFFVKGVKVLKVSYKYTFFFF